MPCAGAWCQFGRCGTQRPSTCTTPRSLTTCLAAVAAAPRSPRAEGKRIRSLGFIAQRLVQMARDGDLTRIHDLPVTIDQGAFAEAHELATDLIAAGRAWKQLTLHAGVLLSSTQVEALADLIKRYGRNAVVDSFDLPRRLGKWPAEREIICAWSWWEDFIVVAVMAAAKFDDELDEIFLGRVPNEEANHG